MRGHARRAQPQSQSALVRINQLQVRRFADYREAGPETLGDKVMCPGRA